jgi:hypothetical protein
MHRYPPQNNTGALIGPSVGIQATSGTIYFSAGSTFNLFPFRLVASNVQIAFFRQVPRLQECVRKLAHLPITLLLLVSLPNPLPVLVADVLDAETLARQVTIVSSRRSP